MTEVTEKPTLTFEDKNYVIEDLSHQAKYIIDQLRDLQQQTFATSAKLDQIGMARQGFENALREELSRQSKENVEEGAEEVLSP